MNLKQCLLAINTQLRICFVALRRVSRSGGTAASPQQIPRRTGAGARSRAVCSPIRACQCARRRPQQIATATFVSGSPWGRWQGRQNQALCVQIGALPAWLRAVWLHITKTPGRRGGNELSLPLSQPPRSQQLSWMGRLCVLRLHKHFLAMMMSFLKQHMFYMQEERFSLSLLNIWPSEELRMTR